MRTILVAITLLSGGVSLADPGQPKLIRVSLQFIEMPHPVLTELLGEKETGRGGQHARAVAFSKEGKARILETCVMLGRSGEKIRLESVREEIFPTDYTHQGFPSEATPTKDRPADMPSGNPMMRPFTAFETRNAGVTVQAGAKLAADERTIDVRISPEIVTPLRLETLMEHKDPWGDASVRMPIYESWRVDTSLSVTPGKFELVSAITPKPNAPVPAVLRKILVFVRADIVAVPTSRSGNPAPRIDKTRAAE